ncbi:MAG: non-hydrolyzing UDP-N-acetylglucosamine 2-epimerase [Candidatus Limnocylindria bacterium]
MPSTRAPIAVLFGTRPEAIKLAPVIIALREVGFAPFVVTTGQHPEMVIEVLDLFGLHPDADLALMRPGQSLDMMLARAIERVGALLADAPPRAVLVQGDTTSMLGSAIAAFHHRIPVGHVEAGLRSNDLDHPFPEEMNRSVAARIARWHFAPTISAAENLRSEGITSGVHVVGNTVVDALRAIRAGRRELPEPFRSFLADGPYLLATAHRRESWDGGIGAVAAALRDVLAARPELRLVFATHPNPIARQPVDDILGGEPRALIVDALAYPVFLDLLAGARLAVSDSGGVQEEGPTLGVPVLVTRATTERPEGVEAGAVRLVGTDEARVRSETLALLGDDARLAAMSRSGGDLYGDGTAARRIATVLRDEIGPP